MMALAPETRNPQRGLAKLSVPATQLYDVLSIFEAKL
jgi:hypothetical protein